jgi:hypothetical protein
MKGDWQSRNELYQGKPQFGSKDFPDSLDIAFRKKPPKPER